MAKRSSFLGILAKFAGGSSDDTVTPPPRKSRRTDPHLQFFLGQSITCRMMSYHSVRKITETTFWDWAWVINVRPFVIGVHWVHCASRSSRGIKHPTFRLIASPLPWAMAESLECCYIVHVRSEEASSGSKKETKEDTKDRMCHASFTLEIQYSTVYTSVMFDASLMFCDVWNLHSLHTMKAAGIEFYHESWVMSQ